MPLSSTNLLLALAMALPSGDSLPPAIQACPLPNSGGVNLPVVGRGQIEPAIANLPKPGILPASATSYHGLTEMECQCTAAAQSRIANMLEEERRSIHEQVARRCKQKEDKTESLKDAILYYSALEDRNRSAGLALEFFFRLAETEGRSDLLEESLKQMGDTLTRSRDLRAKGLRLPVEYEVLVRQELGLRSNRAEAQLIIEQLNGELANLLGMERSPSAWRFWPMGDFTPIVETIDDDVAVSIGLAQRPQLTLLRIVEQQLDAKSLAAVTQLLQSSSGLVGMGQKQPKCPLVAMMLAKLPCTNPNKDELEARRRQVQQLRIERERAVANEIRLAIYILRARTQLVALARERSLSLERDFRDVEGRSAKGLASFADVATAKLEWLKARGDAIKEVMAWHAARIKLKEAQGLLVHECSCGQ